MPKGKPWTREQERQLQDFVKAKLSIERIAKELGMSTEAVRIKLRRLGLEVVDQVASYRSTTTEDLPKDLFTVEQVLLFLARAVKALEQIGLEKAEVLRLRSLVQACRVYQDKFAEYVNYRRIETEVMELRKEVAALRASATFNSLYLGFLHESRNIKYPYVVFELGFNGGCSLLSFL